MGVRRRIEITLTTRQTFVVRSSPRETALWCPVCARLSQMITPDEAAVLCATRAREIYRLIESAELHFVESDGGLVLVCLESLAAATLL